MASLRGTTIDFSDALAAAKAPLASSVPAGQAIAKLNYSHDAMIDLILANPAISQNDIAAAFGYTAAWVSRVMSSDAFKARFAARKKELVDPEILSQVEINFSALVLRSQAILMEKLDRPAHQVPDTLALRAFEIGARAAGYGIKPTEAPQHDATTHLAQLANNLTNMLRARKAETIEGEVEASEDV